MNVSQLSKLAVAGALVAMFGTVQVLAGEPTGDRIQQNQTQPGYHGSSETHTRMDAVQNGAARSLPSKKIVGAAVQNSNGEKIGSIEDLVIDADSGKVTYAALGVGGVLGIGEKLFAVPFEEFKLTEDSSKNPALVLDISKERLEKAPGFDKNNWPDFGNPQWRSQINSYYHRSSASRTSGEPNTAENR